MLALEKKAILSQPMPTAILREGLLFEIEIFWGPENKEQLQTRGAWDTLPQCLNGKRPIKVVVQRGRMRHRLGVSSRELG
jgi:hypothetical protein